MTTRDAWPRKLYGSVYFYARVENIDQIPSEVILAVNTQGIIVVDQETKDVVTEYPFKRCVVTRKQ